MAAMKGGWPGLLAALCVGLALAPVPAVAGEAQSEQVFASVNGKAIGMPEVEALYAATMRQRFYHGKVPEGEAEAVRKEVMDLAIGRVLLLEEARRRGLQPDAAKIDATVAEYDTRYGASPGWQQGRDQILPAIREQLAQQNLLEQLDEQLRKVAPPAEAEVHAYYDRHRELFTEPERLRLSMILIKIEPSSPKEERDKAREEAQALLGRIRQGEDFAELARQYSSDSSSAAGGDIGYIHRGMLPDIVQDRVDEFRLGEVAEPIDVLEGIVLFRLDGREPERLREFADVENQARDLLVREAGEQARMETLARLRGAANIEIFAPAVAVDQPTMEDENGGESPAQDGGGGDDSAQ